MHEATASHISAAEPATPETLPLPFPPPLLPGQPVNSEPIKRSLSAHSLCAKGSYGGSGKLNGKVPQGIAEQGQSRGRAGDKVVVGVGGDSQVASVAWERLSWKHTPLRCLELILKHTFRRR